MARILVVDDETELLNVVALVLRKNDHDVMTAGSSEEAVELLSRIEFDVALLDFNLSGMDGLSLAAYIQRHAPSTLIILMSGDFLNSQQPGPEFLKAGVGYLLPKPFDVIRFTQELGAMLSNCKTAGE